MKAPFRGYALPILLLAPMWIAVVFAYFWLQSLNDPAYSSEGTFARFAERQLRFYLESERHPEWLLQIAGYDSRKQIYNEIRSAYRAEQLHADPATHLAMMVAAESVEGLPAAEQLLAEATESQPIDAVVDFEILKNWVTNPRDADSAESAAALLENTSPYLAAVARSDARIVPHQGAVLWQWNIFAGAWSWLEIGVMGALACFLFWKFPGALRSAGLHGNAERFWSLAAILTALIVADAITWMVSFGLYFLPGLNWENASLILSWNVESGMSTLAAILACALLMPRWSLVRKQFGLEAAVWKRPGTWAWLATALVLNAALLWSVSKAADQSDELFLSDFLTLELADVSWHALWAQILLFCVWAPVGEELLFRGILFGAMRKWMPWGVAAILSSLIFSFLHFYSGLGFVEIACAGMLFALLYQKTGSLLPGMLVHAWMNGTITMVGWGIYGLPSAW